MIEAAKKGAYGVMTRKEVSWRPETLVCKRFNVPEIGARYELVLYIIPIVVSVINISLILVGVTFYIII